MLRNWFFLFFIILSTGLSAQNLIKDTVLNAFMFHVDYSFQVPAGDIADRYGVNSYIGAGFLFKVKNNFLLGAEGGAIIGNKVKEEGLLAGISDANGNIIGIDGLFADIGLFERGYMVKGNFGKIISFNKPNPNSGLTLILGAGAIQHRIKIEVDEGLVPQLDDDHKAGYDRLSNGFLLSQFVGYTFISNKKGLSFYAGFEFNQGFTKHRRKWNFTSNNPGEQSYVDHLMGIKVGWVLPIYFQTTEKYFYY